ncbi:MAG: protease complex subunit PrcB family protein [Thermoanaerobaculia bacterium]
MRNIRIVTLALLLAACGTADGTKGSTLEWRALESGTEATGAEASGSDAAVRIATTPAHYRELWNEIVGAKERPQVDFERESVIFLLLGTRSTGGYAIEPKEVRSAKEGLDVSTHVTSPGKDTRVTQVITHPYAVIAVGRPDVDAVRWVEDHGGELIAARQRSGE